MNLNKSMIAGASLVAAASLALSPVALAKDNHRGANVASTTAASLSVNPSGQVMVRGALVTGVSGSIVSATTAWGSESLVWNIGVASTTQVLGANGGRIALADVKAGDRISFQGGVDQTAANLTVNARVVRDLSQSASSTVAVEKPAKRHVFEGKVQSISGSTLTLAQGKKTYTVNVSGTASTTNLKVGSRVLVTGIGSSTITASNIRVLSR